jgi:hypothetical protein
LSSSYYNVKEVFFMAMKGGGMFSCDCCGDVIDDAERILMERDEIFDKDSRYDITELTCPECRKEIRKAREELEGDYSPLHPNETVQEFEDHEDYERS